MTTNIREVCALVAMGGALLSGCGTGENPGGADDSNGGEIVVQRYELAPVDFGEAARSSDFKAAVADFEHESNGQRVAVVGLPGAAGFRIPTKSVERELWDWHDAYRGRGAYAFRYDNAFGYELDSVIVLPTDDQWTVLDAAATDGVNHQLSHGDVVRELRDLDTSHPFVVMEAGIDYVAGRFQRPVADADQLAKRLYRFCPDIVDQGTDTVVALARELERTRELYCWWD